MSSSRFGPASGPAGGRCIAPGRRRLSSSRCGPASGPAGGRCIAPGRRRICSSRCGRSCCFRSAKTQGRRQKTRLVCAAKLVHEWNRPFTLIHLSRAVARNFVLPVLEE